MTKPIEWTTTEPQPAKDVRHVLRVRRYYHDGSRNEFPATPADLSAALAAMGEGERAEVLERFVNYYGEPVEHLRAEKDRAWRAVSEARKDQLLAEGAQEKAERERDEARLDLARALKSNTPYSVAADEAIRDRDMALGERNRAQAERDTERACRLENEAELHRADKELGELRTRLIAAETAAAQREPREYPLAEGSRWEGDMIVDNCNLATRISDGGWRPLVVSRGLTSPYLADVLALAHRRGLL